MLLCPHFPWRKIAQKNNASPKTRSTISPLHSGRPFGDTANNREIAPDTVGYGSNFLGYISRRSFGSWSCRR